jgi:two-component system LytT family response regulator
MLHVLIADDEHLARTRLRKMLAPFEEQERLIIVDEAEDGEEALVKLRTQRIDLLFLDIRMPEMDGFTLLERLDPEHRPIVVFTTAYDEYAMQAFQSNAVHYLLKPIAQEQLAEAVERAEQVRKQESRSIDQEKIDKLLDWIENQEVLPHEVLQDSSAFMTHVTVPNRERYYIFPLHQLVSVEVQSNITRLYFIPEVPTSPPSLVRYIVPYTLEELEARLNPTQFIRVHRGAIINLDHLKEVVTWFSGRYKLILYSNHEVISSRERAKLLKKRLYF